MLKLFIYGYFYSIRSSRKLAKQCLINREVIWLIKGIQLKYRVLADFRKENSEAFEKVFKSFFNYCIELGLYGKELTVVNGTKLEASASKRKNYSLNKLSKMRELAQNRIKEYMHQIEINDTLDENKNKDFDKETITSAIKILEEKLEYYRQLDTQIVLNNESEINFTDPDAKAVRFGANQGTDLGYNVQVAVDAKNKPIVAYDIINNSVDRRTITRAENEDITEVVNNRVRANKEKYMLRQTIVEHPFGRIKRPMNFYYLLLRGFGKVRGEVSLALFTYNSKRVINILGVEKLLEYIFKQIYFIFNKYKIVTISS